MELKMSKRNKTLVVTITGEIDHCTCQKLRQETEKALEHMGGHNFVFSMEGVTFMDSSGIGVMIGRYKVAEQLGGRIAIVGADQRILQIFQMSAISGLLPCFATLEEAMAYVEGGK